MTRIRIDPLILNMQSVRNAISRQEAIGRELDGLMEEYDLTVIEMLHAITAYSERIIGYMVRDGE